LFVPQDTALLEEYQRAWSLSDALPVSSVGIVTARDQFAIAFGPRELAARIADFVDRVKSDDEPEGEHLRPGDKLDVKAARQRLAEIDWEREGEKAQAERAVQTILYRPFDTRSILYEDAVLERPRREVMRHMLPGGSLGLIATAQTRDPFAVLASRFIVGHKSLAAYDINTLFPLYLYPTEKGATLSRDQRVEDLKKLARQEGDDEAQQQVAALLARLFPEPKYSRWPNLDPLLLAELEQRLSLRFVPDGPGDLTSTFGPEDVFAYIYAILHCPTYRTRYAEFLKRDFPRIPFTSSRDLFAALVAKGRDLIALHLMESPLLNTLITSFPERGSDRVERVEYNPNERRVYIHRTQYFDRVPKEVWEFHVGGYQVCDKWLKDRKGRKLDNNDLQHYQKIVVALNETIRLMAEIDALIPSWPVS
jgi:predicted helicase